MNISLLAIPVLLDTTSGPAQLVDQWVSVYHYGHRVLPGISIATCLLYTWAAVRKRKAGRQWRIFAAAGITTLSMLPFTWTIMRPTNNALFAAQIETQSGRVLDWDAAAGLVTRWTLLHTSRALLPLTGAVIGWWGTLQQPKP